MKRIAAIGMFDGVHTGHRVLLDFLREQGNSRGLHPAVITFENHPAEVVAPDRTPPLLSTPAHKLRMLRSAGISDIILLHFDEVLRRLTATEFMKMLHNDYDVDCLVIGYDHRFGRDRSEGFEQYVEIGNEIGVEVLRAPEQAGVSSSEIRRNLSEGRVGEATKLLGHPYYIDGTVVAGKRLGRTIGFPTANLQPTDNRMLIPKRGVYIADVLIDDETILRRAMLNIGHRPTVDAESAPETIEVHVLDYNGDLYGHIMRVYFLHRLRSERAFDNLDSLRTQLTIDRQTTAEWKKEAEA